MKKLMMIMGVLLVLTLVVAGCAKVIEDEQMPEASTDDVEMIKNDEAPETADNGDMSKEDVAEETMTSDVIVMNDGDMAPEFSLKDVDGNVVRLMDFKGEKVYVRYWASWCSICLAGMDEVDTLSNNEDFKVITIVTPEFKGEKSSEAFIQWFPSLETENLVVLLDEDGMYAKEFGIRAYPTSAYIGSDGILVQVLPGHSSNEAIAQKMATIQ